LKIAGSGMSLVFAGTRGDAFRTFLTQILVYVLALAQGIVIARALGPGGKGVYVLASICTSLFMAAFGGINAAIAFRVSKKQAAIPDTMANGLVLALLVTTVPVATVAGTHIFLTTSNNWLDFAATSAIIGLFVACFNGLFLGAGDVRSLNYSQILNVAVTLGLTMALLLALRTDVRGALGAWVAGPLITLVWMWKRSGLKPRVMFEGGIAWNKMRSLLVFALQIGATNAISFLNYRTDSFLIERFAGFGSLGIYSVAVGATEAIWLVSRAVSTAIYGRLGGESSEGAALLAAKALRHTVLGVLALGLCVGFAGPILLPLIYGAKFQGAVPALLILLPGNICYGLASVLSAYFTNHLGRPGVSLGIAGLSVALDFAGCLVLIPRLGLMGAAAASSLSYVASIALMLALFVRSSGISWGASLIPRKHEFREQLNVLWNALNGGG